jgi:hypothetical protein
MSLINEALKKAQRARSESPADDTSAAPGTVGGVRIAKRSQPRSANAMVLFGSAAVVLVVLSVVATVYLMNRPEKPVPAAVAAVSSPAQTTAASPESRSAATVSTATLPLETSAVAPAPPVSVPVEASKTTPAAVSGSAPASTPAIAPVAPSPVAPPPPKADERVAAFVEAIRVTGIRSSGTDSRVLMNDRVFRVNDLVDRTLGVRLTKVGTDSLTFADAHGFTYVKQF